MVQTVLAQTETDATEPDVPCADEGWVCEQVLDWWGNETFAEVADWVVQRPLRVLLIIFVAWIVNRLARRSIDRLVQRLVAEREETRLEKEADELLGRIGIQARIKVRRISERTERAKQRAVTLGAVLRSLATFVIYVMALLISLGELGINLGPFIAGAGIAGIALGFGAQSLVKDFLAGIFIVIEDQYGVGDIVDVGEVTGTIEKVTLRTTSLRDIEGSLWVVPNGEITRVGNMSQLWARAVLDIDVAYDSDIARASDVILQAAMEVWHEDHGHATILEEPEIWGVQALGSDAVSIRLAVKTEPAEQWAAGRLIRARVKAALDAAGIEIPFPQRTVWIQSGDDQPANPPAPSAPTGPERFGGADVGGEDAPGES